MWPRLAIVTMATATALVAIVPAPLIPVARAYAALCERYPIALLLCLGALALVFGVRAGVVGLLATFRCNRRLQRAAAPLPARLARVADRLGLDSQLTYLADPLPMACCYGLLRPRVAVTAGLLARLDDAELAAVLGHEQQHLRRHDPLRLLTLDILAAAAFMFPIARALRQRAEARMEVAADRAALGVAPREALAGALLAVLTAPQRPVPGIAWLSATEARIAHLAGRPALPALPVPAVVTSLGMAILVGLALLELAAAAETVRMLCPFCPWFS